MMHESRREGEDLEHHEHEHCDGRADQDGHARDVPAAGDVHVLRAMARRVAGDHHLFDGGPDQEQQQLLIR